MRRIETVPFVLALLWIATAATRVAVAQETTLQNDGYVAGQSAGFQAGFVAGEMAASRFIPVDSSPRQLNRVQFLFGGATTAKTIRLRVWTDIAGTDSPGTEIYVNEFALTGSNTAMQEIDLASAGVVVSGAFRVGIEFLHAGLPSVARDDDGSITSTRNFIYTTGTGWVKSNVLGLTGDWVIRAVVGDVTTGGDPVLQNDGFVPGQSVGFQAGFVAGEMAASRFVPVDATPRQLNRVQFLFGGATITQTVRLHVWDDAAGTDAPGAQIFVGDFAVTGSNTALHSIELGSDGIVVSGAFRVGLEFLHTGLPSVARDGDGNIQSTRNFIYTTGTGWVKSSLLGLTGDWVIRSSVGDLTGGGSPVLKNDGFVPGQSVGFQAGFVAGEMAASRFVPADATPRQLNRVQFLLGGATTTQTVRLHIWDDAAGTDAPGAQIFVGDFAVTGSNTVMHEIDLVADGITIDATFRVGLEFLHDGLPSVARDGDGNIQSTRNFIFASGLGWVKSSVLGLTGDWVIRAVVGIPGGGNPNLPEILSAVDVLNDQGRQLRLRFARSAQDAAGAATPILQYEVLRRVETWAVQTPFPMRTSPERPGPHAGPASVALDGWDHVAVVPAHGDDIYGVVVPTLADSSISQGMRWSVFMVRAATALPLTFYQSLQDSGYSVDNLPPAPPAAFAGAYSGGVTHLTWNPNGETDLWHYRVHRGTTAGFLPGPGNLTATTGATEYDDAAPAGSYYKLVAVDVNGNAGAHASLSPQGITEVGGDSPPAFGLAALGPNPSTDGHVMLGVTLPSRAPARLELFDVHGRLVASREAGALGPGRHAVDLSQGLRLPSGLYLVRLRQGSDERTLRWAVMR